MATEADYWIPRQPKNENGKVDISIVITEGKRRGYCICPKPLRQVISFNGMTCAFCEMPETMDSWNFWYKQLHTEFSSLNDD